MFPFAPKKPPPPPRERLMEVAGRQLPLTVRENARATRLTLRIAAGGRGLAVTVPPGTRSGEIDRFVDRHQGWLEERLKELPARPMLRPGVKVPIRGVPHLIAHAPENRGLATIVAGEKGPEIHVHGERPHLPRRLADYLKREAKKDIGRLVDKHAAAVGKTVASISFKDTVSRWGSCTADGKLAFSWRIMMAPPAIIDYLVAHEVAHLVHMNHGPKFWALCEKLCPRTKEARAWLKRNGTALQAIGF
ncbi:MAG: M48 family metallopeptidase [Phyllobacteriaceae bacterium]|nr:M48 family metallopeptidase [Phyllobacteriaceae bacterium]